MKLARISSALFAFLLVFGMFAVGLRAGQVSASSHREAPMISKDPEADNPDLLRVRQPGQAGHRDASSQPSSPLKEPVGGPNFSRFGDDVLYEHLRRQRRRCAARHHLQVPLQHQDHEPATRSSTTPARSSRWTIRTGTCASTTPSPASTRTAATCWARTSCPRRERRRALDPQLRGAVMAGVQSCQRRQQSLRRPERRPLLRGRRRVFDLLSIRKLPGNAGGGVDVLYELQRADHRPASADDQLTADGTSPPMRRPPTRSSASGPPPAARPPPSQRGGRPRRAVGDWVQVSRLGAPLVNEVVVPLGAKDLWNNSKPQDDAQFLGGVTDPELPKLLKLLYQHRFAARPAQRPGGRLPHRRRRR